MSYLGLIWWQFSKTTVIFEIITLEFVNFKDSSITKPTTNKKTIATFEMTPINVIRNEFLTNIFFRQSNFLSKGPVSSFSVGPVLGPVPLCKLF